jgi:hypothetical protein
MNFYEQKCLLFGNEYGLLFKKKKKIEKPSTG